MAQESPQDCYLVQYNHCKVTFKRVLPDEPIELARRLGGELPPVFARYDVYINDKDVAIVTRERLTDDWNTQYRGYHTFAFLDDAADYFASTVA